jgi:uncharacterized MnhB-related membrane protein
VLHEVIPARDAAIAQTILGSAFGNHLYGIAIAAEKKAQQYALKYRREMCAGKVHS